MSTENYLTTAHLSLDICTTHSESCLGSSDPFICLLATLPTPMNIQSHLFMTSFNPVAVCAHQQPTLTDGTPSRLCLFTADSPPTAGPPLSLPWTLLSKGRSSNGFLATCSIMIYIDLVLFMSSSVFD